MKTNEIRSVNIYGKPIFRKWLYYSTTHRCPSHNFVTTYCLFVLLSTVGDTIAGSTYQDVVNPAIPVVSLHLQLLDTIVLASSYNETEQCLNF